MIVDVLGLCHKVLVAVGLAGVAFVRRCQKLPPCMIEPVLVGSKMAKAKLNSNGGSILVITFKKG